MKRLVLIAFLVMTTAACSQQNFSADDGGQGDKTGGLDNDGDLGLTCTDILRTVNVPVKVVFSVDISGSNVDHYDSGGNALPGNDIGKSRRGGAIQKFFNAYGSRSNFAWSFLTFNDESSYSLIGSPSNPRFSTASSQMSAAISSFYGLKDEYGTPYAAALSRIYQTIANDSGRSGDTKYVVVFISDGRPDPMVDTAELISSIQSIQELAPGQVSFNTIYYGVSNSDAQNRLATMAASGGGAYLNAADGRTFSISDAIQIPGTNCQ